MSAQSPGDRLLREGLSVVVPLSKELMPKQHSLVIVGKRCVQFAVLAGVPRFTVLSLFLKGPMRQSHPLLLSNQDAAART